jgi:topoisomerase-4 subunit A
MLRYSTDHAVEIIRQSCRQLVVETWHFASLERIFVENRIYRDEERKRNLGRCDRAIDEAQNHTYI